MFKRYRAYKARLREEARTEREAERAHQLALVTIIAKELGNALTAQVEGLKAISEASSKQTEVISTWLKGFAVPAGTPSTFEPEPDVWVPATESQDYAEFLPPEFKLAFELNNQIPSTFDREGSDFR